MNKKQIRIFGAVITIIVGVIIGWSVLTGNVVVPIIAIIFGMATMYLLRSSVKEVTVDERTYKISEKASRMTIQLFAVATVVVGTILIVLSQSGYPEFEPIGITLMFSASALILLYLAFYGYYSRKY